MITGYTRSSESRSTYAPVLVYIFGIQNSHEIEKICRKRTDDYSISADNI